MVWAFFIWRCAVGLITCTTTPASIVTALELQAYRAAAGKPSFSALSMNGLKPPTRSRVEVKDYGDMGDVEQSGTDFLEGSDYPSLVALMAPRPTLLTYNGEDDCCFRAMLVKPRIFDAIQPFFKLYGKQDSFNWHENRDPGNHNYQLDNRLVDYLFFTREFGLAPIENEDGVAAQLKSYDELKTTLPADNLTILDLARKLGRQIEREPVPGGTAERAAWTELERGKLR